MLVLIIGNGFDVYHKLPTRYKDFLNVIKRLQELKTESRNCQYLRYMFGESSPLYVNDEFIQQCYRQHQQQICGSEIDIVKRERLVEIAKNNSWLKLLVTKNNSKNINWIDFENELGKALKIFEKVFDYFRDCNENDYILGIDIGEDISFYDFDTLLFFDKVFDIDGECFNVKKDYVLYSNDGNNIIGLNEEKIIRLLIDEWSQVKEALEIYICEFIEKIDIKNPVNHIFFEHVNYLISFNYTKTFDRLYKTSELLDTFYIHGEAGDGNIILGINSDSADELDDIDLRFVHFKKYFQKMQKKIPFYGYKDVINSENDIIFAFFGHSLDRTDGDIIKDIILCKNNLHTYILSHNQDAYEDHVKNLIYLFGKSHFEKLIKDKKIIMKFVDEPI